MSADGSSSTFPHHGNGSRPDSESPRGPVQAADGAWERSAFPSTQEGIPLDYGTNLTARHVYAGSEGDPFYRPARVILWGNGTLVQAARERLVTPKDDGDCRRLRGEAERNRAKRRPVMGFTPKARLGLLRTLAQAPVDLPADTMTTLTYPTSRAPCAATWRTHLDAFGKRVRRRYPDAILIWKREFTRAGVTHHHLLTWRTPVNDFRPWAPVAWAEASDTIDYGHTIRRADVQPVRAMDRAGGYLGKYVAKCESGAPTPDGESWGRWWGIIGRGAWEAVRAEPIEIEVPQPVALQMQRAMRRFAGVRSRSYPTLTVFASPGQWGRLLAYYLAEHERGEG